MGCSVKLGPLNRKARYAVETTGGTHATFIADAMQRLTDSLVFTLGGDIVFEIRNDSLTHYSVSSDSSARSEAA